METPSTCDRSATNKYRLKYTPFVQFRRNCAPKFFTSGSQKWALNHHVNSRDIFSSRMVVRIQWSRERPCVYRRPPLTHQDTYPDKLTNVENVLARRQKARLSNIILIITSLHSIGTDATWGYSSHEQTLFRSVNNDCTLVLPWRNVVVLTCTSLSVVQQKFRRLEKGQTSSPCDKNNQSKYSTSSERISPFLS